MRNLQGIPREWLTQAHLTPKEQRELEQREKKQLRERLSREEIYAKEEPDFDTWQAEK